MNAGCLDALAAFERRLSPDAAAPVAAAFSGGGDSLAALLAAKAWSERVGRRLVALHVDHRLQPASADWAGFAAETAARLGVEFRRLVWAGEKPASGIAAAARAARHRLLANAARALGARVIVFGHTADDILEAELMRSWGAGLGALKEWSPSPVWPEGREVFALRPLLHARRAELRQALSARGERWIDDPANLDPRQARARARQSLSGGGEPGRPPEDDREAARLADAAQALPGGALRFDRRALDEAGAGSVRRVVAAASLSVGGGTQPPRGARLEALAARLRGGAVFRTALRGARIIADQDEVLFARDAGEVRRGGLAALALEPGQLSVWDGRFELVAARGGLTVQPLAGLAARLPAAERSALRALPAAARPGLPALVDANGAVTCPVLAGGAATARALVQARFRAASGAISKEPAA